MIEVFDRAELLEELDGDREFLEESVEMLETDAPSLLKEIREALDRGDAEAVSVGAHTLESMVGNFCAQPAFDASLKMEMLARSGDLVACAADLESLQASIATLQNELRQFLEELE